MNASTLSATPPAGGSAAASQELVLVVDDEVFIRSAFQLYLETMGYAVVAAESGERAIEIFEAAPVRPQLVILDLVMPGIDGIEVLKALKSRDPLVEVIIATGCGSLASAIEALRWGAFDYITKPIVNFDQDLLRVVREALKCRREKGPGASKPAAQGRGPAEVSRLRSMDHLTEIACLASNYRRGDPILERLEDLLRKHFSSQAGTVLCRGAGNGFTPLHAWGLPAPISLPLGKAAGFELLETVQGGILAFFLTASIDPAKLGFPPSGIGPWPSLSSLPLCVQGRHWGALLLLHSEDPTLLGPPETHPFQVLAPLLASLFSAALGRRAPIDGLES